MTCYIGSLLVLWFHVGEKWEANDPIEDHHADKDEHVPCHDTGVESVSRNQLVSAVPPVISDDLHASVAKNTHVR
jgi:hypothetical protein